MPRSFFVAFASTSNRPLALAVPFPRALVDTYPTLEAPADHATPNQVSELSFEALRLHHPPAAHVAWRAWACPCRYPGIQQGTRPRHQIAGTHFCRDSDCISTFRRSEQSHSAAEPPSSAPANHRQQTPIIHAMSVVSQAHHSQSI